MTTAERLLEEARDLPPEELEWLAEQLWACVELSDEWVPSLAWQAELDRRLADLDAGTAELIPASEFRRRWGLRS